MEFKITESVQILKCTKLFNFKNIYFNRTTVPRKKFGRKDLRFVLQLVCPVWWRNSAFSAAAGERKRFDENIFPQNPYSSIVSKLDSRKHLGSSFESTYVWPSPACLFMYWSLTKKTFALMCIQILLATVIRSVWGPVRWICMLNFYVDMGAQILNTTTIEPSVSRHPRDQKKYPLKRGVRLWEV